MPRDLDDLLEAVKYGRLRSGEFEARLEEIHRTRAPAAAELPEYVELRREALARFEDVTQSFERHHQLERLAETLAIDPARGRLVLDGH